MIRVISNVANCVEASIQSESVCGSCLKWLVNKSIADVFLNALFKSIAYNAATAAVVVLALWIIICILYLPLFWISFLISSFGAFILLLTVVALLLRSLSRSMSFAGRF